jgi:hypothetical protein
VQVVPFVWVPTHIPATQLLLAHWSLTEQVVPLVCLGKHAPPAQ